MMTVIIGGLLLGVAYFAKRWRDSEQEISELRQQISVLKRRRQALGNGR